MNYQRTGLTLSPCIRTAPQFPHFNSTVGLSTFSAGGAVAASAIWTRLAVVCVSARRSSSVVRKQERSARMLLSAAMDLKPPPE